MRRSDNAHFLVILATRLWDLMANNGPICLHTESSLTIKDDILVLPFISWVVLMVTHGETAILRELPK